MTVRLLLASFGFLIILGGALFGWRARQRLVDKRVSSPKTLLALAVIFLGLSVDVLGGVRTDNWSIVNWLSGVSVIAGLVGAGMWLGAALEMRRQQRTASREAHPPIGSNGAQA